MSISERKNAFPIFVTRDIERKGITIDIVVKISEDKFKSIMFKHTQYKTGEFVLKLEDIVLPQGLDYKLTDKTKEYLKLMRMKLLLD